MKNIASYLILLLFITFSSCDKFTDIHKDFIKNGEIVYAPSFDSVVISAGKERVEVLMRYFNGHNLKYSVICWNDRQDSLVVDLSTHNLQPGLQSLKISVDNLVEGTYIFNIYNIDKFNNKSLVTTTFGASYGADFQSTIGNRGIKEMKNYAKYFELVWSGTDETLLGTEIKYIDKSTDQEIVTLIEGQEASTIFQFKPKDDLFSLRAVYIPEESAVDYFYSEWSKQYELPDVKVDRASWVLDSFSDAEEDWAPAQNIFDDDMGSKWHSEENSSGYTPLPHWVIVDMGEARTFSKIETSRGNKDRLKACFYEISNDKLSWIKITDDIRFDKGNDKTISATVINNTVGRYLRIYVTQSWDRGLIDVTDVQPYE